MPRHPGLRPQGEDGFGYDPVFFVPALKKTFAELSPAEKNAISHRGMRSRPFGRSWSSI
ncbi:MAG: non-canonical purine NTP pyrophosphatase [Flavonifractor plautii]